MASVYKRMSRSGLRILSHTFYQLHISSKGKTGEVGKKDRREGDGDNLPKNDDRDALCFPSPSPNIEPLECRLGLRLLLRWCLRCELLCPPFRSEVPSNQPMSAVLYPSVPKIGEQVLWEMIDDR